ncbi:hypothetical protein [Fibrobacter sp.]|uniref:hypothetical protein n=1 Tax=Fibrobacter sp. TaxID=35828 RepID=UPI0025BE6058|nr:hypothetical protein [Fibrobacter sp.]MBR4006834.1 hypothetical protein [Fibrobacter sp.]
MKKMTLSAIVLGLAAAGAFAQAPAAAPAAAPAEQAAAPADSVKAAEEAKKAEEAKAAEEAKKAEEAKAAEEAKKAEEAKAAEEAKKAEEAKAAEEAKKAEEAKAAEEAKKAEEAKTAEEAKAEDAKPAENTNPGEVANAAGNAFAMLKASMNEETSAAQMEVKFSGSAEFDIYSGDVLNDDDFNHSYWTTFDFNIDVKFNDKWSAHVGLEADGPIDNPGVGYNGAFVQYKPADFFAVKFGDLTFTEGAFKAYYGYDDPQYNAAGMKEHDIRGLQIDLAGLELGFGFGRGANDRCAWADPAEDDGCKVYNAHVAYEFDYAGQHLRPFFDYKSYQQEQHNELHAGIDAGINIGGFSFRAVYGFHADYLLDDEDIVDGQDWTSTAHAILAEPSFDVAMFQIKTTFFYAFISDTDAPASDAWSTEIPEYFFVYAEPALKVGGFMKFGIPVEFHTNTLDDDRDDTKTIDVGGRLYLTPVENLDITAFGMVDIPIGDNDDDTALRFGVETVFNF